MTIEDVAPDHEAAIDAALARVGDAVALALGRSPDDVWSRFLPIDRARFGAAAGEGWPRHPIVTVATGEQPIEVRERVLRAAAEAAAAALGASADDVWVRFDVLPPGTVLTGGELQ